MNTGVAATSSLRDRITGELREFAIIAAYLYVCFTALAYLKAAILQAQGIPFAPFGFAALKALICAKFLLIGQALHLGERFRTRPLIWRIMHKSFVFLLLLLALNALEEVLKSLWHGRTLIEAVAAVGGGRLDQILATSAIMLLILIPFFAIRVLGEVLGERKLARLFFASPRTFGNDEPGAAIPAE